MTTTEDRVTLADINCLIAEETDYLIEDHDEFLELTHPESGLTITATLDGDVLFFSAPYTTCSSDALTPARMQRMLDADNGISTSFFQVSLSGANAKISLNAYVKLQSLDADDRDDIRSVLDFMIADVYMACRQNF